MAFKPDKTSIPPWQKVLDAATLSTPIGQVGTLPAEEQLQTAFQTGQGTIGNLPENIVKNPLSLIKGGLPSVQAKAGMQGIQSLLSLIPGSNIKPIKEEFIDPSFITQPKSIRGKVISNIGNVAAGMINLSPKTNIANVPSKGAEKAKSFFSAKPLKAEKAGLDILEQEGKELIQKEYGSLTPYISGEGKIGKNIEEVSKLKKSRTGIASTFKQKTFQRKEKSIKDLSTIKKETEELAVLGEREANDAFEAKHSEFVEAFTEKIGQSKSSMTNEDFASVLREAAKEYGAEDIPGTPGNVMKSSAKSQSSLSKRDDLGNIIEERIYTAKEVQALSKQLVNQLPDIKSKATFYNHFLRSASEKAKELVEAKASYKPIFELSRKAEAFKTANIKRMSKPNFSETLLKEAQETEKQLGVQITGRASTLASKRSEIANSLRTDINDLNQIKDKELNRIYERISQLSKEKPQLIHEAKIKIDRLKAQFSSKRNFLENEIEKRKWRKIVAGTLAGIFIGGGTVAKTAKVLNPLD